MISQMIRHHKDHTQTLVNTNTKIKLGGDWTWVHYTQTLLYYRVHLIG